MQGDPGFAGSAAHQDFPGRIVFDGERSPEIRLCRQAAKGPGRVSAPWSAPRQSPGPGGLRQWDEPPGDPGSAAGVHRKECKREAGMKQKQGQNRKGIDFSVMKW